MALLPGLCSVDVIRQIFIKDVIAPCGDHRDGLLKNGNTSAKPIILGKNA